MDLGVGVELLLTQNRMRTTKGNHSTGEAENVTVLFETEPVVPARFVGLAVGVVVAALCAAKFVPAENHRHAARDQQGQQEILDLALPQGLDPSIRCLTFRAVVLTEVCVSPVMIVFSVCFIVLVAIAHQVVQSEAVVAGDEVDAARGAFAGLGIDVGTAADAAGKQTEHPIVAAPEAADIITEPTVPLRPAAFGEAPDLIRSGGIPRLGNDLHLP